MPELPEVETVVRELKPLLEGGVFGRVILHDVRSLKGEPPGCLECLEGEVVERLFRRGKYICFGLGGGGHFTVHLGMTGKLLHRLEEKDGKHLRVEFLFEGGRGLYFVDTRIFGRLKVWAVGEPLLPGLGVEPLHWRTVFNALKGKRSIRAVKTVIMDQHVLAGVGNIYADESLFRSRIHPETPLDSVAVDALKTLSLEIPRVLKRSIRNKGTTVSDYRTPDASSGRNQFELKVYGRSGEGCLSCGTEILRIVVNGRGTHFCPSCQPRGKGRKK